MMCKLSSKKVEDVFAFQGFNVGERAQTASNFFLLCSWFQNSACFVVHWLQFVCLWTDLFWGNKCWVESCLLGNQVCLLFNSTRHVKLTHWLVDITTQRGRLMLTKREYHRCESAADKVITSVIENVCQLSLKCRDMLCAQINTRPTSVNLSQISWTVDYDYWCLVFACVPTSSLGGACWCTFDQNVLMPWSINTLGHTVRRTHTHILRLCNIDKDTLTAHKHPWVAALATVFLSFFN